MKKALVSLLALLAGVFGAVMVESPAMASFRDCPSGYFCLWTGAGATGSRYQWSYNTLVDSYNNGISLTSGVTNRGMAFYNRTGDWVTIYDDAHCNDYPWSRDMFNGQSASAEGSDWALRVSSLNLTRANPLPC